MALLPIWISTNLLHVQFNFGGTSLLIVVGVALDTMQQMNQHLLLRKYDGFMKKGRIRFRGRQGAPGSSSKSSAAGSSCEGPGACRRALCFSANGA